MLTRKQAEAADSALLVGAKPVAGRMLRCPSCDALSISRQARHSLHPLWNLQCPACRAVLRLRRGRVVFFASLAALVLLTVSSLVGIGGLPKMPPALIVVWVFIVVAWYRILVGRLSLETKR